MQNATQNAQSRPIRVAVVGHTNTGKTSLIRTLLRDERFGEIDDLAGTTRVVEKSAILAHDREVLTLFDTPGFEDSSALLQTLDELTLTTQPSAPLELLRSFIGAEDRYPDFAQELKVLRQAIQSDVLLYIIDVREPLLGKYRDEVEILSKAGKPIIPVFNFIAGHAAGLTRWREQMAHFNLHAALEFDTVAFDFEAEKRLYQKLQSLLEPHYVALQGLIDYRQRVWLNLSHAAAQRIFHLLAEVGGYRREVAGEGGFSRVDVEALQNVVRGAEQRAVQDLLAIFAFTQVDVDLKQLPVRDGEWELDIFSPSALKAFGLNAGASAMKGAAAGAGIDLMVGGMSLGAASLLGAALGAGWATLRRYEQEVRAALRGHRWLCVDDNTMSLLYLRQRALLQSLTHRGHAAQTRLEVTEDVDKSLPKHWGRAVKVLRRHPHWQIPASDAEDYRQLQAQVTAWLLGEGQSSAGFAD